MQRIKKILWDEGNGETRTLKDVDVVTENEHFITLRTQFRDYEINKRYVVKIEREVAE